MKAHPYEEAVTEAGDGQRHFKATNIILIKFLFIFFQIVSLILTWS